MKSNNKGSLENTNFFLSALLLIFITLKLCKVISWSWWWVFAPLWIPAAIVIVLLVIAFIFKLFSK